jgi:glycosyltransferase involved in cell wall biosynthesis
MRICYVLNSGSPGGVEQHVLDLVNGFAGSNKVYVICSWGDMVPRYFQAGARIKVDAPKFDIDPLFIIRLANFIRKANIDILHTHQLKTSVNALIAGWLAGVPVRISHVHTPLGMWQVYGLKKAINIFVYHHAVNLLASKEISLTPSVRRVKIKEGINADKVVVIPNGVSLKKFEYRISSAFGKPKARPGKYGTGERAVKVGTLSRLTVEKNVSVLLAAIERFSKSKVRTGADASRVTHIAYQLFIAGDGPLRKDLEQQALELGIADRVEFLGFIDENEKPGYLHSLDIFVMPSLAEGFGIALVEAMACGCACVVSDLPVLRDVGAMSALYFDPTDAEELADILEELLANENLRAGLGQKAEERVRQQYSMGKFIENYSNLYKSLIT